MSKNTFNYILENIRGELQKQIFTELQISPKMWLAICFLILPPHLPQFAFLSFASSEEVIIFTKAIQISIFHEGKAL